MVISLWWFNYASVIVINIIIYVTSVCWFTVIYMEVFLHILFRWDITLVCLPVYSENNVQSVMLYFHVRFPPIIKYLVVFLKWTSFTFANMNSLLQPETIEEVRWGGETSLNVVEEEKITRKHTALSCRE